MDKDGDGKVTEGEATIYLERMGLRGFDKNSSFAYFDKNKDGFLSVKEISSS
jgi:Ca2+-binding EF-hand superfamily protein